jgi:hypothetical protein
VTLRNAVTRNQSGQDFYHELSRYGISAEEYDAGMHVEHAPELPPATAERRRKQQVAVNLTRKKWTLPQVADKLQVPLPTLKGWLLRYPQFWDDMRNARTAPSRREQEDLYWQADAAGDLALAEYLYQPEYRDPGDDPW